MQKDPYLAPVNGVRLGTACAGIRWQDRDDLVIIEMCEEATCAAVFTRNQFCAAPVELARRHLKQMSPRFLLINSGNANAGTGSRGYEDTLSTCRVLAAHASCPIEAILPFSTGVIGEPLPTALINAVIPKALANLSAESWQAAARAIMTTDTVPKGYSERVDIAGHSVTLTGIAKGAGMIQPNMATMLAFIATDAAVSAKVLDHCLRRAVECSFNRITVDGDTSTNDACVLIATAKATLPVIHDRTSEAYPMLEAAIGKACCSLAQAIIRDGEGATKFIAIEVEEGNTEQECLQVAYCLANSPLVKTAFFASDPNWGRMLAAVGRADIVDLDIHRLTIYIDEVCVVRNGARAEDYTEEQGRAVMARHDIGVRVNLGRGRAKAKIWTCDLSYEYIRINTEYRT